MLDLGLPTTKDHRTSRYVQIFLTRYTNIPITMEEKMQASRNFGIYIYIWHQTSVCMYGHHL